VSPNPALSDTCDSTLNTTPADAAWCGWCRPSRATRWDIICTAGSEQACLHLLLELRDRKAVDCLVLPSGVNANKPWWRR
jgi:hypothetical protein